MERDPRLPAVTTAEAKGAATEIATKELTDAMEVLYLYPTEKREEQNKKWLEIQENLHLETKNFIALTTRREREHYWFMKRVLKKVEEYTQNGKGEHDHSKEGMFFFALPALYDGGVKGPKIKEMADEELKRHYILEPHHPEYEKYSNGKECSKTDIVEMAVDRLARNAQFGDGWINLTVVEKFKPTFTLGDNKAKQKIFWDSVLRYKDLVQQEFYDMYPEARDWRKKD